MLRFGLNVQFVLVTFHRDFTHFEKIDWNELFSSSLWEKKEFCEDPKFDKEKLTSLFELSFDYSSLFLLVCQVNELIEIPSFSFRGSLVLINSTQELIAPFLSSFSKDPRSILSFAYLPLTLLGKIDLEFDLCFTNNQSQF